MIHGLQSIFDFMSQLKSYQVTCLTCHLPFSECNCVLDVAEHFTCPCLATSINLPSITAPGFAWNLLEGEREWAGVDANQVQGQVKGIVGVGLIISSTERPHERCQAAAQTLFPYCHAPSFCSETFSVEQLLTAVAPSCKLLKIQWTLYCRTSSAVL